MSKKNLLQEGTVRSFMKLAGTEAIASDFLNEGHGHSDEDMMQEEDLAGVNLELSEEEIVQEVSRRVAKRIMEAKKAHDKLNKALGK